MNRENGRLAATLHGGCRALGIKGQISKKMQEKRLHLHIYGQAHCITQGDGVRTVAWPRVWR
ncbi:MAG: hypothetical protein FWF30_04445, partial [Coriobacteriia bacterium]|nr:hypothetical protein [Coriobacteriia bacterium]